MIFDVNLRVIVIGMSTLTRRRKEPWSVYILVRINLGKMNEYSMQLKVNQYFVKQCKHWSAISIVLYKESPRIRRINMHRGTIGLSTYLLSWVILYSTILPPQYMYDHRAALKQFGYLLTVCD